MRLAAGSPARAGIDLTWEHVFDAQERFPRSRGDRPSVFRLLMLDKEVPRSRGDRPEPYDLARMAARVPPLARG